MNGAAITTMRVIIVMRRSEIRGALVSENDVFHGAARGATKSNSAGAPPEALFRRVSNTQITAFV